MSANRDEPERWQADIATSVATYNRWFMEFAPDTFRRVRVAAAAKVAEAFDSTRDLTRIDGAALRSNPSLLPVLRMCTAPPLAVDRLIGLAEARKSVVGCMEQGERPSRCADAEWASQTNKLARVIDVMLDHDLFPWLRRATLPSAEERSGAIAVVADRLSTAVANPAIRNAQEARQLVVLERWLEGRGYRAVRPNAAQDIRQMPPGTYGVRMNLRGGEGGTVTVTIDAVVQPLTPRITKLPVLIEAKSAGDFTNVNKRRKEEADKMTKLRSYYGDSVEYVLLLGGYFDNNYLGYETEAGIDFVWEHRIEDLAKLSI
jgi:hypothetical protein